MDELNVTATDPTGDPAGGPDPDDRPVALRRGDAVGRYVILDRIGGGGMGVVYAAYDPELDRKLALKLLRTAGGEKAGARRTRLIREAQAMARLSHRNVITVHDVGTVDDQVFVAMEFIDGTSLAQWMGQDRGWAAVIEVFAQAGQGLAAAHGAGLVHRDFKPDNVMIAHSGRVVVTDFGLARASAGASMSEASRSPDEEPVAPARQGNLSTTVTAVGAIMGTPAYMAPEQHEGRAVDARSDQFAFAVALYEALYGRRPFPGDDVASLAYHVGSGNVRPPPSTSAVPSRVRSVILRALSVDPDRRFVSMDDLLAALVKRQPPRPRWGPVLIGVTAATALGVYAGFALDAEPQPCAGASERSRPVLGAGRLKSLERAFAQTGLGYAEEAWPAVSGELDRYRRAWATAYVQACEATHVRGEQSPALLDLRMGCLARRLVDVDAQIALFESGDPQAIERALEAVQTLPHPRVCEDTDALTARVPPPDDPSVAGRVEHLRPELARVSALARTGIHQVGLEAARELVARARDVPYAPLQAEALLSLATFEQASGTSAQAETHYREALALALRGRADGVASASALALASVVGADAERTAEADGWAELADALLVRTGAAADTRAELLRLRSRLLEGKGDASAARVQLRGALELLEAEYGADDPRVADAAAALGGLVHRIGDHGEARKLIERALEIEEYAMGLDHPKTAALLETLGAVTLALGDAEAALGHLQRVLAIREEVLAAPAPERIATLRKLSRASADLGQLEAAGSSLERAFDLADQDLGPTSALAGELQADLAALALRRDEFALALTKARRARKILAPGRRAADVVVIRVDVLIGRALLGLMRPAEAYVAVKSAIEAIETARGAEDPSLAEPLTVAGLAALAQDKPARAVAILERALAVAPGASAAPRATARARFALARALRAVGDTSPRATTLAQGARDVVGPQDALALEIDAFLAQ